MENSDHREESILPDKERRRGQHAMISVAAYESAKNAAVGVFPLFLLGMGATAFQVGAQASLMNTVPMWALLGLRLMPGVGKVRLGIIGRLASNAPLVLLMVVAGCGGGVQFVWPAIALNTARAAILTVGQTGWWPLLQDCVAGDALGAFFARLRTRLRVLDIVAPTLVGLYLGRHPSSRRFIAVFALAFLSMVIASWRLRRVPERPAARDAGLWARLRGAARERPLRRFVAFISARSFVATMSTPFWVVLLTANGLPANAIVWFGAIAALGNVVGLQWWGRLVDNHGSRAALTITVLPEALLGLAFLAFPSGRYPVVLWAVPFYLLWGVFEGGFLMGQTRAMMDAVPAAAQAEAFTLINYGSAAGGMLGGLLGGVMFQRLSAAHAGAWGMDGRTMYLAAVHMGFLVTWGLSRRLSGHGAEMPARRLLRQAVRRVVRGEED